MRARYLSHAETNKQSEEADYDPTHAHYSWAASSQSILEERSDTSDDAYDRE